MTLREKFGPVLAQLRELARQNLADFREDKSLVRRYEAALGGDSFRYTSDSVTCGRPDCWSTFRELAERQEVGGEDTIGLDCEDDAAALAAWLASKGRETYVGIIPGVRVSHAVAGVKRGESIVRLDPALWHGMPNEIDYERPHLWIKVSED